MMLSAAAPGGGASSARARRLSPALLAGATGAFRVSTDGLAFFAALFFVGRFFAGLFFFAAVFLVAVLFGEVFLRLRVAREQKQPEPEISLRVSLYVSASEPLGPAGKSAVDRKLHQRVNMKQGRENTEGEAMAGFAGKSNNHRSRRYAAGREDLGWGTTTLWTPSKR
jgi:hypothetical protein